MFDDILFRTFELEPIKLDEIEKEDLRIKKQSKKIVEDFIKDELQVKQGGVGVE